MVSVKNKKKLSTFAGKMKMDNKEYVYFMEDLRKGWKSWKIKF